MRGLWSGPLSLARRLARSVAGLFATDSAARGWTVAASIVTILGLPVAVWQLHDLREQRTSRTSQTLLMVDQQLGGSFNRAIRHRIVRGESLLKPSGPFLPEDLDDFLDVLEVLADMADRGLVDRESLDFWYGDLIARTAQHPEVRAYIRQQQAKSPDTYTGLEDLAKTLPKPSSGSMIRRAPPSP